MAKIDIAGLKVDAITKIDLLGQIAERIAKREKTFVVTPYSEFLYASLRNPQLRALFNSANYSIADGVGILWAQLFLAQPLTWPGYWFKVVQAAGQVVWTGASILLHPKKIYEVIPEKIVGADLIWDLAKLAEQNGFSVFLLGSRGDIAQRTAEKLKAKFPRLKIAGTSNKEINDPTIVTEVNNASSDMLLVTFQPQKQEQWIAENLDKTTASFAIGLGGTFDYIAGAKSQPPRLVRAMGLEWLYRLITQPSRIGRIYRGVFGLIISLMRYKVIRTLPFRKNGCAVVVNAEGKVLLCKRMPNKFTDKHSAFKYINYWQFPQGGLDKGEDIIAGTKRELAEETGIVHVETLGMAKYNHSYEWNAAITPLFSARFKYKGQSQHTVFLKFTGSNSEIQLDNTELSDYQWVPVPEVMNVIAPERREHARIVLAELAEIPL